MKFCRIILIALLPLFVAACGLSTPVKLSEESAYTITGGYLNIPSKSKTRLSLLVSLPVADPGYQSSSMIYMDTPFRLKQFANNRWVAPPAEMLLPLLAQRIRSYGYFKAVVTPPFSGITHYRLDTKLLVLQQEFLQPVSFIRLVMQATVVNNVTNKVVASQRFQTLVSAPDNNPYSGVLAANKAAGIQSKQIALFVIRSIRRSKH